MKLLLTGCGRSGTHWIAHALTQAGVPCTHEEAFTPGRDGTGNWAGWTCEASWCAAPHTPRKGVYVVHLVRNPLDVCRSRVDKGTFKVRWETKTLDGHEYKEPGYGPWAEWAMRWCPGMRLVRNELDKAAIHWVQWNRLVVSNERLRLEDVTVQDVNRLARIVDPKAGHLKDLPGPNHQTSSPSRRPTFQDLRHIPGFIEMAREYGYETE